MAVSARIFTDAYVLVFGWAKIQGMIAHFAFVQKASINRSPFSKGEKWLVKVSFISLPKTNTVGTTRVAKTNFLEGAECGNETETDLP
jgi:hypothetical protein